jgi:hypothetical protein
MPIPKLKLQNKPQRTLWKASLKIADRKDEFLFRDVDDFSLASVTAVKLLETSPAAHLTGAVIVSVERVARLWN